MMTDKTIIRNFFRWVYVYMYPTGCSRPREITSIFLELYWLFVIIPSGLWQAKGRRTDEGVTWPLTRQKFLKLGGFG
jgi:hypothetical protein